MNRRALLLSGFVGTAALVAWPAMTTTDEYVIEMVVRKRLDYLKLDAEGVRRFARDTVALHSVSHVRLKALATLKPIYERFYLSAGTNSLANLLRHGEERIVGSYLISSDFFVNDSDESRIVQYQSMLDPMRACGNPFARRIS
jgi:hypothetical protein